MLPFPITEKFVSSKFFRVNLLVLVVKQSVIKLARLVFQSGEVVLCLLTLAGPFTILVMVLATNIYLLIKPLIHSLHPSVTYKQAFARCRREVCRFYLLHAKTYHRYSIEGFEKIPNRGGAVLVYYHGPVPMDYVFLAGATVLEKNRIILSIVDKGLIWVPGFEMLSAGLGCFAGTRQDCVRLLRAGRLVGIAPGGGLEAQCASSDTYEILWKKRKGFASIAKEAGVPIIPIFTENIRETVVNMQTGRRWWKSFYDRTRIPITPLYGGFPVQLTTHVGDPIHPNDHHTVDELRQATVDAMEALIQRHQVLPGDPLRAVIDRVETESRHLSRILLRDEEEDYDVGYVDTGDSDEDDPGLTMRASSTGSDGT